MHPHDRKILREHVMHTHKGEPLFPASPPRLSVDGAGGDPHALVLDRHGAGGAVTSRLRGVMRHLTWDSYRWVDFSASFKWVGGRPASILMHLRASAVERRLFWDKDGNAVEWPRIDGPPAAGRDNGSARGPVGSPQPRVPRLSE